MSPSFIICVVSVLAYVVIFIVSSRKISALKKEFSCEEPDTAKSTFISALGFCFLVIALPFIIPLKTHVIGILCACSLLGEITVFKEKIEKFKKN